MVQAFPETDLQKQQATHTIEAKYATDMRDAGRIPADLEKFLYPKPELTQTVQKEEKKKKVVDQKTAKRHAAQLMAVDGPDDIATVAFEESQAAKKDAETPGKDTIVPVDKVEDTKMATIPQPQWESLTTPIFRAIAGHATVSAYLAYQDGPNGVKVQWLEASQPVVWHARATTNFAAGAMVLVAFNCDGVTEAATNTSNHTKRPTQLHPSLTWRAIVGITVPTVSNEEMPFVFTSPMASNKKTHEQAPPPFWAVIATDAGVVNMKLSYITVTIPSLDIQCDDGPKRKKRKCDVTVTIPAYINRTAIKSGDLLTCATSDSA